MAVVHLDREEVENDELPPVCLRCGAPTTGLVRKNFSWHPPWVIVLILAGLLVYVIVAIVLTKRMTIRAPLCAKHQNHWFGRSLIIWLSLAAVASVGLIAFLLMVNQQPRGAGGPGNGLSGFICVGTVLLGLAWLIMVLILQGTMIRPSEITDRSMTLNKVSRQFVEALDEERDRYALEEEDDYRPRPRPRALDPDRVYDPAAPRPRRPPPDAFREDQP